MEFLEEAFACMLFENVSNPLVHEMVCNLIMLSLDQKSILVSHLSLSKLVVLGIGNLDHFLEMDQFT